ncbi:MAG: DUF4357 domain-containing protein [Ilumatobacteraceae bacterium]
MDSLKPLLSAGLISAGDILTLRRRGGLTHKAFVETNGYLKVKDARIFKSPSGAAKFFVNRPINGWDAWKTASGASLSRLRDSLAK